MLIRYLATIIAIFIGFLANAQLVTNNAMTPDQLVRNVLVGTGVEVSNVTYTGGPRAMGEFFGGASNLGLGHGIIMSSGTVLDEQKQGLQNGPVGPNNRGNAGTAHGTSGDSELAALVNNTSEDAAILEFDFIPQGDEVNFRYIFGSEEYPEWVGDAKFNDAFAFFISGPGIAGSKNIALVPGTSDPVSIGNINAGNNSAYYIDNGNGSSIPQNTDATVINYDGFTTVLTATSAVQVCETYHLKIVISDMSDNLYDSGVFLEAGSLSSPIKFSSAQTNSSTIGGDDKTLIEGCNVTGKITLTRTENINDQINFSYVTSGTATDGSDYIVTPNPIVFSPGQTVLEIDITPLLDAPTESDETIIFKLVNQSGCDADTTEFDFKLKDNANYALTSSVQNQTLQCENDNVTLSINTSGGFPTYTTNWTHGKNGETISEAPATTTTYTYTSTDQCNNTTTDSIIVTVPVFVPLGITSSNDTTIRCPGIATPIVATATNGSNTGYTYSWSNGSTGATINPIITKDSTLTVTVTDVCGEQATTSTNITVNYPAFSATTRSDTLICVGDQIILSGFATGGIPPYSYSWNNQIYSSDSTTTYSATSSASIPFMVKDSCASWIGIDSVILAHDTVLISTQQPVANFGVSAPLPQPGEIIYMQNLAENAVSYNWDLGNGTTSTDAEPTTTYDTDSTYTIRQIVTDNLGCTDTIIRTLEIVPPFFIYAPNSFTPNDDGLNDEFEIKGMGIVNYSLTIYDRWGIPIYNSLDIRDSWAGNFTSSKIVPTGIYVYKLEVTGTLGREYNRLGHISLIR